MQSARVVVCLTSGLVVYTQTRLHDSHLDLIEAQRTGEDQGATEVREYFPPGGLDRPRTAVLTTNSTVH